MMPCQPIAAWMVFGAGRKIDGAPFPDHGLKVVVDTPILEFLLQCATHAEFVIWRDGHVALVVETVQVRSQKQAIAHFMGPALGEGLDVRGVEDGEAVLAGDGAGPTVGVGHRDSEGALAKPGPIHLFFPIAICR